LPPIRDVISGKYLAARLRNIDIGDLLGRIPIPAQPSLMQEPIRDKAILVTGGAGSIATALAETAANLRPSKIILLDTNEHGLFQINASLQKMTGAHIIPVLGSIANKSLVERVLRTHDVKIVYHCAAYKHIGLAEINLLETIQNNIIETRNLIDSVLSHSVEKFVLISSDKAVHPTSVMGATKRWAELIVRYHARQPSSCTFSTVRFGNVLGSSGSVVPIFQQQISTGGPITLTDDRMTRYFMSLHEAAELIIQASALAENGDIFVLKMGEPIRIRNLAEKMIILAGLTVRNADHPSGDIEIITVGARTGEKLHEELFYDSASVIETQNPRILRAKQITEAKKVPLMLERMQQILDRQDEQAARTLLFEFAEASS
jgi:FlaA1/EpsC-like NDP-sugar epimerase